MDRIEQESMHYLDNDFLCSYYTYIASSNIYLGTVFVIFKGRHIKNAPCQMMIDDIHCGYEICNRETCSGLKLVFGKAVLIKDEQREISEHLYQRSNELILEKILKAANI